LFAQNKTRREGDLLKINIDSSAQQQIDTKVSVIKKLLKQLEEQEQLRQQQLMQEKEAASTGTLADGSKPESRAPAAAVDKSDKKEKEEPIKIDSVPTRVVERIADGNYRVKGAQPFMIGKREYKVIVTGIIRPEDYNDEGVSSGKLLDPQYDVVSLRRKE
jgi:flagellar L-ring protein precursor FlgH